MSTQLRTIFVYAGAGCVMIFIFVLTSGRSEPYGQRMASPVQSRGDGIYGASPQPLASAQSASYPFVTYVPLFSRVQEIGNQTAPADASLPDVYAQSAGLYNVSAENPVWEYRADVSIGIASVTKLMTALLVKEYGDGKLFTIATNDVAIESVNKDLRLGDTFTANEAIHFLLIASDNALANVAQRMLFTNGKDAFVSMMNQTAADLGMTATHFSDAIGLGNNVSTASDLARFVRHLVTRQPDLLSFSRYAHLTMITEQGRTFVLSNTNQLISRIPGFIGSKTGYTPETGGSLLVVFETPQGTFASIVLGSPDRFGDTSRILSWYWNRVSDTMKARE